MQKKHSVLEYETALRLFENWLESPSGPQADKDQIRSTLENLGKKLRTPVNVTFIGPDRSLVRRFSGLVAGDEEELTQFDTEDFRPVVLVEAEDKAAYLRWWDREGETVFDGKAETAQSENADFIALKGPFGLSPTMSVVDMSSASDTPSHPLVKYALTRLCDILIWVCTPDEWASVSTTDLWKSVPGAIRKKSLAVVVSDTSLAFADLEHPNVKVPAVSDCVLDLTSSEIAIESGDLSRWSAAGAEQVFEDIHALVVGAVDANTAKLAPQLDAFIDRYTNDGFWQVVIETAQSARDAASEEAKQAAGKITETAAEPKSEPPAEKATPKAPVSPEMAAIPDQSAKPSPDMNALAEIWMHKLQEAKDYGVSLARPDVDALLTSLCAQLSEQSDNRELVADCEATLQILNDMKDLSDEEADFAFGSILCQLASTIADAISSRSIELPRGSKKVWNEPVRA